MIRAGRGDRGQLRGRAVDLHPGGEGGDDRDRDQGGEDRADGDDGGRSPSVERHQRLARRLVADLGLGVAALPSRSRAALLAFGSVPQRTVAPHRLQGGSWSSASWSLAPAIPRPRRRAAALPPPTPGCLASRIARTTQRRRAPARDHLPAFRGLDPADREERSCATLVGGVGDQLQPDRRPARLGRRLPDRADARCSRCRRSSAAAICSSEWVDRPMIASGPSTARGLLDRAVVLSHVHPVGVAGSRQVGVVVDDEEGAE